MRPTQLHIGGTLYWTIRTFDPDKPGVLKDADSTPTVAVLKNGASTLDSVTVTKRAATTGLYDCSYNPAGEAEGDKYTIEESATVTGSSTAQDTYSNGFVVAVVAVERGTDNAVTPGGQVNLVDAPNSTAVAAFQSGLATAASIANLNDFDPAAETVDANVVTIEETDATDYFTSMISAIATAVWAAGTRTLTAFGFAVETDTASRNASKADVSGLATAAKLLNYVRLLARKDAEVKADLSTEVDEINADTGTGTGSYDNETDSQEATVDRGDAAWVSGDGSSLTGANSVTITVTDGTDPIEGARVRVTLAAQSEIKPTDASGEVSFTIDNGSWSVAVTAAGFAASTATLVVDGDETAEYELTALTPTPVDSPWINGQLVCYDAAGVLLPGAVVTVIQVEATPTSGIASGAGPREITANGSGVAFIPVLPGAKYHLSYQSGTANRVVTVPADAADGHLLGSIFG